MKVLIVDDIHFVLLVKLIKAGCEIDYQPTIGREEAIQLIPTYQGLIIRSKFNVDEQFIGQASQLRFIGRAGAGMDNIDELAAAKRGIALFNAPEGNRQAVAEHMIGMLLHLFNNLGHGHSQIQQHQWLREDNRGVQLSGRKVGIIGYGHNGQAMAKCLSGFGVEVLAYDKYHPDFDTRYARSVSLEELKASVSVLSLHIPLTAETRGMVDADFLAGFREPLYLLNGSRGEIVHMEALVDALDQGQLVAAALDVLPVERFPALAEQPWFEDIIDHPNVLLSPHVAGWSVESYFEIANVLSDKIVEFLD